jgi:fibronectin type 3 domain-containing protein
VKGRLLCTKVIEGVRGVVMVLNATFNNISVISWWSVDVQSDQYYVTFQGNSVILSHKEGGRLIQV